MDIVKIFFSALCAAAFMLYQPCALSVQAVQDIQTVNTESIGQDRQESARQDISEIAGELGIDTGSLSDELTPEAKDFFAENNIAADNPEAIAEITPKDVFIYVWEEFKKSLSKPLTVLSSLLAVILVAALIEGMEDLSLIHI